MIALKLVLTLDDKSQMRIEGVPNDNEGRKVVIQLCAEAIKTISALKPYDPNGLILPDHLKDNGKPAQITHITPSGN